MSFNVVSIFRESFHGPLASLLSPEINRQNTPSHLDNFPIPEFSLLELTYSRPFECTYDECTYERTGD